MLYIVATPIGNLQDISLRAIAVLKQVQLIAAEDTRHSRTLLQHLTIDTPLIALHEHNEHTQSEALLQRLEQGESIALVSDAGTPLISDPGYYLVKRAHQMGIKVVPIPGPSALITALSAAGLPTERFTFEGFLASKAVARAVQLKALQTENRTLIFYEAPHRIAATITAMSVIFGAEREAVIARELTKHYETIYSDRLGNLVLWLQNNVPQQRGEFVIVVHGAPLKIQAVISSEVERIMKILRLQLSLKQAVTLTGQITGVKKNLLYTWALQQQTGELFYDA